MTVIYNGGKDDCDRTLEPLLQFKPDGNTLNEMPWADWVHIEEGVDVKSKVYHHHSSFVFAKGALDHWLVDRITKLTHEAYRQFHVINKGKAHFLWDYIGGVTTSYQPKDTPFPWRDGVYVSTLKLQWNSEEDTDEMMDFILKCKLWLEPFAIQKKAAYLNYIDSTIDDWQYAYYSENYACLQEVKQRWDPDDFFRFDRSIELPGRTRRIAAIRPLPVGASDQVLVWSLPDIDLNQYSRQAHAIRPLEHDIAHQTASERTVSLWTEYSMHIVAFEGLSDNPTDDKIFDKIKDAREIHITREIKSIVLRK